MNEITIYSVDRKIDLLMQEVSYMRLEHAEHKQTVTGLTDALHAQAVTVALLQQTQAGHNLNFSRGWEIAHWLITVVFGGYLFFK